jgi:peptidoglycan/LPS O-acetylase OafA/YrhL
VQFSLTSVVYAVVVEVYLHREGGLSRVGRVLTLVGVCSYSLYLIHQPFLGFFVRFLASIGIRHPVAQVVLGFPIYTVLATLGAWLSYVAIEQGGVRLGKRLSTALRPVAISKVEEA